MSEGNMVWDPKIWCQKCHRTLSMHVPGEEAVYVEYEGEVLVVGCMEANPYLTPYGSGRVITPQDVQEE